MMALRVSRLIAVFLLLQNLIPVACKGQAGHIRRTSSIQSRTTRTAGLGDRVSKLDLSDASCVASTETPNSSIALTSIKFYYSIESDVPVDDLTKLESILFVLISTGVLWCVSSGDSFVSFGDGNRRLDIHRRVTLEDARRLSIISFNTAPGDKDVDSNEFDGVNDPCKDSSEAACSVVEGRMSIVSHQTDNLELAVASILDGIEEVMDSGELVLDLNEHNIKKVTFLGETLEEVKAGVVGGGTGGGGNEDLNQFESDVDFNELTEDKPSILAYAVIPMVVLLSFALLVAKNKSGRSVLSAGDLFKDDYVITGTGDPPRSFHEGLYHYTRSGARYLSTNCRECAETRKMGFFTDDDLPTINEGQLYDPANPCPLSEASSDDLSSQESTSHRRRRILVLPSDKSLGKKHSSIDVHKCASATCRICAAARGAGNVAFVCSPAANPDEVLHTANGQIV